MFCSDHNGSVLRQQPGAMNHLHHRPHGMTPSEKVGKHDGSPYDTARMAQVGLWAGVLGLMGRGSRDYGQGL